MGVRRHAIAPVAVHGDRIGFVGEQVRQQPAPAAVHVLDVWRDRRAVQHVAEVDERGRQDDYDPGHALRDQLRPDELAGAGEHDPRHRLGERSRDPGIDGVRAVREPERRHAEQQRQLRAHARKKLGTARGGWHVRASIRRHRLT